MVSFQKGNAILASADPQEFLVENGESVSLQTTQVLLRVMLTQGKQNWAYWECNTPNFC